MRNRRTLGLVAFVCLATSAFGEAPRTTSPRQPASIPADPPAVIVKAPTELIAVAFSADGSQVATSSRSDVRLLETATGKELKFLNTHGGESVAFNRNLSRVALSRIEAVDLHDAVENKELFTIDTKLHWEAGFPFRPRIMAMAFSPNGRQIATAGGEAAVARRTTLLVGVVKLWDVETGKELARLADFPHRADAVAFSPNGKYLAAGTQGVPGEVPAPGEVRVWDAATFAPLRAFKMKPAIAPGEDCCFVLAVAFNRQGTRLAAAVSDGTVHVWELPSGRELLNQSGHQGPPGGHEIDATTGLVLGRLRAVRCLAFHHDGQRLALAGYDRVVRVWDVETGKETDVFRLDVPRVNAVAFSVDGRRLAAAGGDATNSGVAAIWPFAR